MSLIAIVGSKGCGVRTVISYLTKNGFSELPVHQLYSFPFQTNKISAIENKNIVVTECSSNIDYGSVKSQGGIIVRVTRYGYPVLLCPYNVTLSNDLGIYNLHQDINTYLLNKQL